MHTFLMPGPIDSPLPLTIPYARLEGRLQSPRLAFLLDHVVQGMAILPGAAMLECGLATLSTLGSRGTPLPHGFLAAVSIPAPLPLDGRTSVLSCEADPATGALRVASAARQGTATARRLHLLATGCRASAATGPPACTETASNPPTAAAALLAGLTSIALLSILDHPPDIHSLAAASETAVIDPAWQVHPALADAALHLGPATGDVGVQESVARTRVVAGMEAAGRPPAVQAGPAMTTGAWVTGRRAPMTPDGTVITDHSIQPLALSVEGLLARPIDLSGVAGGTDPDRSRLIYETDWQVSQGVGGEVGRARGKDTVMVLQLVPRAAAGREVASGPPQSITAELQVGIQGAGIQLDTCQGPCETSCRKAFPEGQS